MDGCQAGFAAGAIGTVGAQVLTSRTHDSTRLLDGGRVRLRLVPPPSESRKKLGPTEAQKVWNELLDGGWVLVEHRTESGQEVLIATRSERLLPWPELDDFEARVVELALVGRSNKFIAIELGVSQSTISTRLKRAMVKLTVRDRAEMQRRFGALPTGPGL